MTNSEIINVGPAFQPVNEDRTCAVPECPDDGIPCFVPDDPCDKPSAWLCPGHAYEAGYCSNCGRFCAGTESFDFNNPLHARETCADMIRTDVGELDEERDDEYDG